MHIHRHCKRWRINSGAQFVLEGAERAITGVLRDISFRGMCVAIPIRLPQDEFLTIKVLLQEGLLCHAEVWVVWHKMIANCQCYGLYFNKLSDSEKENIYEFVRGHFPDLVSRACWGPQGAGEQAGGGVEMEDRRIFQRFTSGFSLSFLDVNQGREGIAETFDVSAKGVGMTTDHALEPRTPLEMWLRIPDQGEPLYTRGYVVWSQMAEPDKYRVGVNLERADLMGLSRIMRLG